MISKNENTKEKSSESINKTQKALDDKKSKEKKDEEKELEDAKKQASVNLNKFKGNLLMAQSKQLIKLAPFILFATFIIIILIAKGGDWLTAGLSLLVGNLSGK
jgi:sorbitol-specific phosphotransferase system component IIBC